MELWRFEGISYNAGNNKLYAALTNIGSGMENNKTRTTNSTAKVASGEVTHVNFDYGGPNHIRVAPNSCGCVMELDVDPSNMRLTKARMTVCGIPKTKTVDIGSYSDSCDPNGIASPDNVAVIPDYNQVPTVSESFFMEYACTLVVPDVVCFFFSFSSVRTRPVITTTSSGSTISAPQAV